MDATLPGYWRPPRLSASRAGAQQPRPRRALEAYRGDRDTDPDPMGRERRLPRATLGGGSRAQIPQLDGRGHRPGWAFPSARPARCGRRSDYAIPDDPLAAAGEGLVDAG